MSLWRNKSTRSLLRKTLIAWSLLIPSMHAHYTYLKSPKQQIHLLVFNPNQYDMKAIKARKGGETLSELMFRHHASGGINGGYFKASREPAGVLKTHKWHGFSVKKRAAIGWKDDAICMDILYAYPSAQHHELVAIQPTYDASCNWHQMSFMVGGAGLLIKNHQPIIDFSHEKLAVGFVIMPHARTAFCQLSDTLWAMVAIDGKRNNAVGMTLEQLRDYLISLGCQQAINLDGGSSTAISFSGKIKNQPYGGSAKGYPIHGAAENRISDAILIWPREFE